MKASLKPDSVGNRRGRKIPSTASDERDKKPELRLDNTDIRILQALLADSGRSRSSIAQDSGISDPYLSKKISQLVGHHVIKGFTVDLDYDKIGYDTRAITFFKIIQHDVDRVVEKIAALNEAIGVYEVLGQWDLCVNWMCYSPSHLMGLIKPLTDDPGVTDAETTVLAMVRKQTRGPTPL